MSEMRVIRNRRGIGGKWCVAEGYNKRVGFEMPPATRFVTTFVVSLHRTKAEAEADLAERKGGQA